MKEIFRLEGVNGKIAALLLAAPLIASCQQADVQTYIPTDTPTPSLPTETVNPSSIPSQTIEVSPSPLGSSSPELSPSPTPKPIPASEVLWEVNTGAGSEPNVSVSPFNSKLIAVTHQTENHSLCNESGLRVSSDGGRTYKETTDPWNGKCVDHHEVATWGPGPNNSSRLWVTDMVLVGGGDVAVGVTYSDNLGKTWEKPYIEKRTRPWVGGFPDLTIDNNPKSPNFGVAYVVYNFLESSKGPGLGVLASGDNGKSWQITNVSALPLKNYPDYWRINYQIKTAPDGSTYVTSYQSNLKSWSESNIFNEGGAGNIGRMGFDVARLTYDKNAKKLSAGTEKLAISLPPEPSTANNGTEFQTGFDIDSKGRLWMAVSADGKIDVGESSDQGGSWKWQSLKISGEKSFKPSLATTDVDGKVVVAVGFHAINSAGTEGTYYSVSLNDGESFFPPKALTSSRWSPGSLSNLENGPGLRENMTSSPNGNFLYAYSDGRLGGGKVNVYLSEIKP